MYQRIGAQAFKKDLSNTRYLLETLGNPERAFPALHIAGTNGKGSVTNMLAACYQAAGLKVGMYTSPHYRDFRERIKLNGRPVGKPFVVDFVQEIKTAMETCNPSFFEITVAMAFEAFRLNKVDIAIVETGLGGRLDSTNVIIPLLSIITNIGYDHQAMLGNTLQAIAGEKAGIIKPDVPVIIGTTQSQTAGVFKKVAGVNGSQIVFADKFLSVRLKEGGLDYQVFDVFRKSRKLYGDLLLGLGGAYQLANLRTSLTALELIREKQLFQPTAEEQIREGMSDLRKLTGFQGRWQLLARDPLILADSAHNTHGLSRALKQLIEIPHKKIHFVLGFVNDKDIEPILKLFPGKAQYYFAKPDIPRGLDVRELGIKAEKLGLKGNGYYSVKEALQAARSLASKGDLIYVGGSSFVVAEVI